MALSEKDILFIDRYLEGGLAESEKLSFTEKVKSSSEFSAEVEFRRTVLVAIRKADEDALRNELKKEAKKIILPVTRRLTIKWHYVVAAAVSCLLLVVYLLLPSTDSLFDTYYSPFPERPIVRSESSTIDHYSLAMRYYSVGDYNKALEEFTRIENSVDNDEIILYSANCLLNLNRAEEALSGLEQLGKSENELILSHAQWYLALAYIKLGKKDEAKGILLMISSYENMYQAKAKMILNELKWVI